MNENEKPAIGSSEAAVLTVVELIARAAQMSEQHMAYWLDLYYQVRSRHEAKNGEMFLKIRPVRPITADDVEQAESVIEAVDDAIEKAAVGSKKKQPLTGADLRAVQKKKRDGAGYQWRDYKRSVLQRLSEARAQGVTSAAIAAASAGKLTENAVMDFLEAAFRPIDDYRELEAALDRLAAEK